MKNKKKSTKKWKKKKRKEREREGHTLLCMWKLCIECERELEIHSKKMRIRRVKNKRR